MDKFSYLNNLDFEIIEEFHKKYLKNPNSIEASWRFFFDGFEFSQTHFKEIIPKTDTYSDEFKVINLIYAYRQRGHLFTENNPVRKRRTYTPTLDIKNFGLKTSDLEKLFQAGHEIGIEKNSLKAIIAHLKQTYCKSIGVEYEYIRETEIRSWMRKKMESTKNSYPFTLNEKRDILNKLRHAVFFEKFMHKRFPGQKRFSLEGAESLIPALDAIIKQGANFGNKEFIIGMAHRGRINVLANILKKPFDNIFSEFEGKEFDDEYLLGDVKYHLGYSAIRKISEEKNLKLTLSPNPSHLESVNPVVQGIVRAKIDHEYNGDTNKITPILIHGDASIAGQGIIYEVIQMSGLKGYKTGGTIHLVINNQIGFTTDYLDGRTSTYCTDIGKTIHSPIFHVNSDDVEAVVYTVLFAIEFRTKFQRDVFIDLLCYRKYGHSEGDDPRFTQPLLYKKIAKHPNSYEIYKEKLLLQKYIDIDQTKLEENELNTVFENSFENAKKINKSHISSFLEDTWKNFKKATDKDFENSPDTSVTKDKLIEIGKKITYLPPQLKLLNKTIQLLAARKKMILEGKNIDWAMGEHLTYGSLLSEGIPVRLSGQDVARGTFSHRHAILRLENSEEEYTPLNHISDNQAKIDIYNSPLSEFGILGFEYGYSLVNPYSLTIWEAQFGDFSNGAQIIIDQFLISAEDKWNVMNHLVVYLPHGYEGQGPEHSSARIERFLMLAAENNIQIANITTPANFFHIIRRQLKRDFRKPLIIFTPKSLLRHPRCVSNINEFCNVGFKEIIDDKSANPSKIQKVIFCSGKIYYELILEKEKTQNDDIALIRLEQIYPLPEIKLQNIIKKYKNTKRWLWVQEEPINMGAWNFLHKNVKTISLNVISRPASGSPATGSSKFHEISQQKIIDKAFQKCDCPMLEKECAMICIGNRWQTFEKQVATLKNKKKLDSKKYSANKKL